MESRGPISLKSRPTKKSIKVFPKRKNTDSIDSIIKKLVTTELPNDPRLIETFEDLPLSPATLKGLSENHFKIPTEIQKASLIYSLQQFDILGAAKTGSGKTLAFILPVLERLFKEKWTRLDGVGALIITPTRELAYQIFEALRKVGAYHDFSAGLIIGGKDLHFEKHRMNQVNIVICTPGRLLQHMDENPLFDCVNMQILVLDEADRCLDMGFEKTMNSIIENLPKKRQTLLFSATQTKSVKDLARLSLKDPKYVSVHENDKYSTPETLTQSYVICELHNKMALLWSFIKNHSRHKIIVFLSSCKQVKYTNEILCKLRPATALLALYGTLHQERRMQIYNSFVKKQHAVLLATDIAARGLDFPEVNWVVQLDCPEDANTYIHRAGRTARYQKGGESLLVLLPSEQDAMLKNLESKKIPINEIKVNPLKLNNPQVKMEAFLAKDPNLKASAQRAFVAYFKSVFLMKDKQVFNINALNTDYYARSLGLVVSPRIRFLQKYSKSLQQNSEYQTSHPFSGAMERDGTHSNPACLVAKGKEIYKFGSAESDSEDDILVVKRRDHELEDDLPGGNEMDSLIHNTKKSKQPVTKAALAKKVLKKNITVNKKVVFSELGETLEDQRKTKTTEEGKKYDVSEEGGIDLLEAKKVMKAEDKIDRKLFREKVKAKHRGKRIKEKKLKKKIEENEDEVDVTLESGSESNESGPDLSWLPDPDKVYGKSCIESDEEDCTFESNNSPEFQRPHKVAKKRKCLGPTLHTNKITRLLQQGIDNDDVDKEPLDTGLSLKEDEELVLTFLSHKNKI